MIAYVSVSTTYVFGTLLTANGNLRLLNMMAATGVALSLIMNLWLIPRLEATGAAISSLTVQAIMALAQFFAARRITGFRFGKLYFFRLLVFIGLLIAMAFLIKTLNISWMLKLGFTLAAGIISLLLTGLVSSKEIVSQLFSSGNHSGKP